MRKALGSTLYEDAGYTTNYIFICIYIHVCWYMSIAVQLYIFVQGFSVWQGCYYEASSKKVTTAL